MEKQEWIEFYLNKYKASNEDVLNFIADIIYHGYMVEEKDPIYDLFANGYCYYFANMLKLAFNRGEVCWHRNHGHIVWLDDNGIAYDAGGVFDEYDNENDLLPCNMLGELLVDFKHNGKEYESSNSLISKWSETLNMSHCRAVSLIYKQIPENELDFNLTVETNTANYLKRHYDELIEKFKKEEEEGVI